MPTTSDLAPDDLFYVIGHKTVELEINRRVIEAQAQEIQRLNGLVQAQTPEVDPPDAAGE